MQSTGQRRTHLQPGQSDGSTRLACPAIGQKYGLLRTYVSICTFPVLFRTPHCVSSPLIARSIERNKTRVHQLSVDKPLWQQQPEPSNVLPLKPERGQGADRIHQKKHGIIREQSAGRSR